MVREFYNGRPMCWTCLRLMAWVPGMDHAGRDGRSLLVFACGRCPATEVVEAGHPGLTCNPENQREISPLTH